MKGVEFEKKQWTSFINEKNKRRTDASVIWTRGRMPATDKRRTRQEDDMAEEAVQPDPRKVDDHIEAPIDEGIIEGLEDHQVRKSANRTGTEAIQFERPIHHAENQLSQATRLCQRAKAHHAPHYSSPSALH